MDKNLKPLRELIPPEILKKSYTREYGEDEILMGYSDTFIAYLVEGWAIGVRYEEEKEIFCSFVFKPGDFIGLGNFYLDGISQWEVVAITERVRVVVFPKEVVTSCLLRDYDISHHLHKQMMNNMHRAFTGYYIFARGGARAFLAYLIESNSQEGSVQVRRYSDLVKVMGISESMLYRLTRELTSQKIISREGEFIRILDREALVDYYREFTYSFPDKF